jgi:hypothetical protein
MSDFYKIQKFCESLTSSELYPNSLLELKGISEKTKRILLKVIAQYQTQKDKYSGIFIETELIKKFLSPSPFLNERFRQIQGPASIRYMRSNEYPQIFYLLGDVHIRRSTCPKRLEVDEWLWNTIISSPVFIDVFLETPYMSEGYFIPKKGIFRETSNTYIGGVNTKFKNCILGDYDPFCQTARFHYADMRSVYKTEKQRKGHSLFKSIKKGTATKEQIKNWKYINDWLTFLHDPHSIVHTRIEKQIYNIENPKIRNYLYASYRNCIRSSHFLKNVNLKGVTTNKQAQKIIPIKEIRNYRICLMDHYLMARCFRTFRQTSGYSRPPSNIIIYAGDHHIGNYIDILQNLGFEIKYKDVSRIRKSNYQCIDISGMEQPMFHSRYR